MKNKTNKLKKLILIIVTCFNANLIAEVKLPADAVPLFQAQEGFSKQREKLSEVRRYLAGEIVKESNPDNLDKYNAIKVAYIQNRMTRLNDIIHLAHFYSQIIAQMHITIIYEFNFKVAKLKNESILNGHFAMKNTVFKTARRLHDSHVKEIKSKQLEVENTTAVVAINNLLDHYEKINLLLEKNGHKSKLEGK